MNADFESRASRSRHGIERSLWIRIQSSSRSISIIRKFLFQSLLSYAFICHEWTLISVNHFPCVLVAFSFCIRYTFQPTMVESRNNAKYDEYSQVSPLSSLQVGIYRACCGSSTPIDYSWSVFFN